MRARKTVALLLKGIILSLYASFAVSQSSAFVGGHCVSVNGMYVYLGNGEDGILGNFERETALLAFAEKNGVNYLIFYSLEGISNDSARQTQLANLISRGRQSYGIDEVGVALGSSYGADEIAAYNNSHSAQERVDVLNLEFEFWNAQNRTEAFADALQILDHFNTVASQQGMETEIYVGWITEAEGISLSSAVDRVLVHFYRQNDTDIINYGLERLQYLGSGSSPVKVAPIFSNEGPDNTGDPTAYFMGPWLENHSMDQPYKTWMAGYQQLTGAWKQNIEVMGETWFLYNYFADIQNFDQNNILSQPQSSSTCTGDAIQLTFSSSASDRDIGWFRNGQCITDSPSISGENTDTLTINSITESEFGRYRAKVVSYDSNNPSNDTTADADISEAGYCQSTPQNLASGRPVSASSYVAAGYEPSLVVDGDTSGMRWASQYTGSQWIQVDLGEEYSISEIKLYWEAAYAVDYQILTSVDGSSWQTVNDVVSNTQQLNSYQYQSQTARYVRVLGLEKALPQWGFSLYELEIYGTAVEVSTCSMT